MLDAIPTTMSGWAGWVGMALVSMFYYLPKALSEKRGETREIDRLSAALAEERVGRKEAEHKNQELMLRFFEQNAMNARLEEQMKHLAHQNEELRQEIAELRAEMHGGRRNA